MEQTGHRDWGEERCRKIREKEQLKVKLVSRVSRNRCVGKGIEKRVRESGENSERKQWRETEERDINRLIEMHSS